MWLVAFLWPNRRLRFPPPPVSRTFRTYRPGMTEPVAAVDLPALPVRLRVFSTCERSGPKAAFKTTIRSTPHG